MNEEKKKALDAAIAKIEKTFGKGSIMRLTDKAAMSVESISTGCIAIDLATGIGGLPRGRIVEIYGPESSGKTTVTLHVIAQAQKAGGAAAFIDAEHALDPVYAAKLGVDLPNLYVSQPDNGEQAVDICEQLVATGAFDVIVIDSVAALTPKAEIEGEMTDNFIGLHARLMSKALRKLASVISRTNACCIFINQLREKVGVLYGSPEVTTGGKALKFFSSLRIDVRKGEAIKEGTEITGYRTKVKIVKNKLAPPFKTAEFDLLFGQGISQDGSILDFAIKTNIIQKAGSWFAYNDEKIGQGKEAARKYLAEHSELKTLIEDKIRELSKANAIEMAGEAEE